MFTTCSQIRSRTRYPRDCHAQVSKIKLAKKNMFTTLLALSTTTSEITHETDMHMYGKASLLKKILQHYLNCPLVPLSHHAQRMYTCHDQAHADKSLAFLLPPLGLYCFPRKLGRAIWAGLLPPEVCALLALLSTCAVYCVQLLL